MGFNVLIVDDSSTIRKIIRRSIQQADLEIDNVLEAGDGIEALDLLRQQKIHVVLTDINMPNMDGVQLLSEMKSQEPWKNIAVLMITTEARADAVVDAAQKGAVGYIKKPFTPVEIHDQLLPILKTLPR